MSVSGANANGGDVYDMIIAKFLEVPEDIAKLHLVLEANNPSLPPAMIPMFSETQKVMTQHMLKSQQQRESVMTIASFLNAVAGFIGDYIPGRFLRLAKAAIQSSSSGSLCGDAETFSKIWISAWISRN